MPTGDITREAAMDDRMCAATVAYGMEAIAGKPGRSGKPLGPMERHQVRKWVERLEDGLSAMQAERWLP